MEGSGNSRVGRGGQRRSALGMLARAASSPLFMSFAMLLVVMALFANQHNGLSSGKGWQAAFGLGSDGTPPDSADGCHHVYLDLGTNIGIQIRKLYEPELYPAASNMAIALFDRYFGPVSARRASVCTFGFEPNPNHTPRLKNLQDAYNRQGWRTKIFTETGVGDKEDWLVFVTDNNVQNMEWGARLESRPGTGPNTPGAIRVVDFPKFLQAINKRVLPEHSADLGPPKVVMKIDIEGLDRDVLSAAIRSGALCGVDHVYVEEQHLDEEVAVLWTRALKSAGCPTTIGLMDDEYYHDSDYPLPMPSSRP